MIAYRELCGFLSALEGWLADDEAVLIYDNYDVWAVDPSGIKLPINITNGYGRSNRLKFETIR